MSEQPWDDAPATCAGDDDREQCARCRTSAPKSSVTSTIPKVSAAMLSPPHGSMCCNSTQGTSGRPTPPHPPMLERSADCLATFDGPHAYCGRQGGCGCPCHVREDDEPIERSKVTFDV